MSKKLPSIPDPKNKPLATRIPTTGPKMRTWVRRGFVHGPGYFFSKGYTPEELLAFVENPAVIKEFEVLSNQYGDHEGVMARAKCLAAARLAMLSDTATKVLQQALTGPNYAKTPAGHIEHNESGDPIMLRPEVTKRQFDAALAVLDRIGVAPNTQLAPSEAAAQPLKRFAATKTKEPITIGQDAPSYEMGAYSREQVRNVLLRALHSVEKAKAENPKKA